MANPEPDLVPVGKAAARAGVSRQSLQYYLMVGLLEPTKITDTGRHLFDQKAIDKINLIKKLNKSGYPLRAIRDLFIEGSRLAGARGIAVLKGRKSE